MTYLIEKYYGKAATLLYPLLQLPYNKLVSEKLYGGCYMYWEGKESIEDYQCVVLYNYLDNKRDFKNYEKLLDTSKISNFYEMDSGCVYVFDLMDHMKTVDMIMDGKFSKIPDKDKAIIMSYYGMVKYNKAVKNKPVHMVLYPEYYFDAVSEELLYPNSDYLKSVGELWSKPIKEKETLILKDKLINRNQILLYDA